MSRRVGLISGAVGVAAAVAGATLVADRKVGAARRTGMAGQGDFADPPFDRSGVVAADDGVRLYYEENGPTEAPLTVVFVHGFCLNRNDFLFQRRALLERLGDDVRLISYDQRSHGRSQRSPSEHATIDQLGGDLNTLLTELVPSGPIVLAGHSMGAMALLALADAHPEWFGPDARVRGLALLSASTGKLASVTLGLPAGLTRVSGPVVGRLLRGAGRRPEFVERGRARVTDVAWVFVKRLAFGGPVDPALVEYLTGLIGATSIDVIAEFYPALMAHDKLAALERLAHTRTVVICGERDLLTPPAHSRAIVEAVPGAELLLVPDTGHQVLMERPDLVNAQLLELLESVRAESHPRRRRARS